MERSAGVIVHPSSIPSNYGIGNFGSSAYQLIDFLKDSGFRLWQMCPLGPTSYGDSPYQSFSAYAGNPYFIDLEFLIEQKLLKQEDHNPLEELPHERVDYGQLYQHFWRILNKAFEGYQINGSSELKASFETFLEDQANWVIDYSNYRALKEQFGNSSRCDWPKDFTIKKTIKGNNYKVLISKASEKHAFSQFIFYKQFYDLKKYANQKGIQLVGDLPIFVALDSADVWAHPNLFDLSNSGEPNCIAGVPPDYFSEIGQLWGNPLYEWKAHKKEQFSWWISRIKHNLELYDYVRIDHFRGFESYWSVPANATTAINGSWRKAPGSELFQKLKSELPHLPIIAEDLGIITPAVKQLMQETGFPGMAVLHFAFGDSNDNAYLPHNHISNQVVYTGTHDNNTSIGWFNKLDASTKAHVQKYLGISGEHIGWDLLRSAFRSVANLAIIPLQDLMSLDERGRFNNPGTQHGNWDWRYTHNDLEKLKTESQDYLKEILDLYGRT
jgi:4-alpha-glucanotransferase